LRVGPGLALEKRGLERALEDADRAADFVDRLRELRVLGLRDATSPRRTRKALNRTENDLKMPAGKETYGCSIQE